MNFSVSLFRKKYFLLSIHNLKNTFFSSFIFSIKFEFEALFEYSVFKESLADRLELGLKTDFSLKSVSL